MDDTIGKLLLKRLNNVICIWIRAMLLNFKSLELSTKNCASHRSTISEIELNCCCRKTMIIDKMIYGFMNFGLCIILCQKNISSISTFDACLIAYFVDFIDTDISPESLEECAGKLTEFGSLQAHTQ